MKGEAHIPDLNRVLQEMLEVFQTESDEPAYAEIMNTELKK